MHFRDVQHQERALSILRRALASGRTHHAYLFEGPEGVGKELAARALTARLLCQRRAEAAPTAKDLPFEACGECESCRLLTAGTHPDLHVIERQLHKLHPERSVRATKGLFLGVDVLRHFLIAPAASRPALGVRRVFIVREAERMNEEAQNALLKTLEEPPGAACLILITTAASRLLPTIRSRCQQIPFGMLPIAFVVERLKAAGVEPAASATLARLSQGRPGAALHWHRIGLMDVLEGVARALSRADEVEGFGRALLELGGQLATRAEQLQKTAGPPAAGEAAEADEENDDGEEDADASSEAAAAGGGRSRAGGKPPATDGVREAVKLVLVLASSTLRDALLIHSVDDPRRCESLRLLPARLAPLLQPLARLQADVLHDALTASVEAERMIDRNVAPQLACERLAVGLCGQPLGVVRSAP